MGMNRMESRRKAPILSTSGRETYFFVHNGDKACFGDVRSSPHMSSGTLGERYLAAAAGADVDDAQSSEELSARLLSKYQIGRALCEGMVLSPEAFAEALGKRRATRVFLIDEIHAKDLFVALAALSGDRKALQCLEMDYLQPQFQNLKRSTTASNADLDETSQRVRQALLLRSETRPAKLEVYTGHAPLAGWLRILIRREFLSYMRARPKDLPGSVPEDLEREADLGALNLELGAIRREHRTLFKDALAEAFRGLPEADALLLRYAFRENLSIDAIAPKLGVHRATVARMLIRVRQRVFDDVKSALLRSGRLSASSADSLCAEMAPHISLTLSRIL
jgi:RNA polymerase sigma-70 factor, ECF subfamily